MDTKNLSIFKKKLGEHDKNRETHKEKVVDILNLNRLMAIKIEYIREFSVSLQVVDDFIKLLRLFTYISLILNTVLKVFPLEITLETGKNN